MYHWVFVQLIQSGFILIQKWERFGEKHDVAHLVLKKTVQDAGCRDIWSLRKQCRMVA